MSSALPYLYYLTTYLRRIRNQCVAKSCRQRKCCQILLGVIQLPRLGRPSVAGLLSPVGQFIVALPSWHGANGGPVYESGDFQAIR